MPRAGMVESESRKSAPTPAATAATPEPAVLAAAIRELGALIRISGTVLQRLVPSPLAGDLVDVIDRRLRDIEAALGAGD